MPTKAKAQENTTPDKYEALVGINYEDKRVEAGETFTDLPESSLKWLLEQSYVRKVED